MSDEIRSELDTSADDDCPFCKIGKEEDPQVDIICSDRSWVAFFPLEPATPGHTLVIPRSHARDLWSLDEADAAALTTGVVRVGRAIEAALSPDGLNLISSSGAVAEQTIYHVHLHVVPRWRNDGFGKIWPPKTGMKEKIKDDIARRIRAECQAPPA
jgi:histidine triad (HIT) family protein